MIELTWPEFRDKFDDSVHEKLAELLAKHSTDALVLFENHDMSSSSFGDRSAIAVGPDLTYKSIEDCRGRHLNDLPSQRQYSVAYCMKTSLPDIATTEPKTKKTNKKERHAATQT